MARGSLGKLASRTLSVAGKWQHQQLYRLNIHEYQGAELMGKYGINVPRGVAAGSVQGIKDALKNTFPSEKEVCGRANVWGDGIIPEMSAHLEGALNISFDGVYHSPAGSDDEQRPWYGSPAILKQWVHHLLSIS